MDHNGFVWIAGSGQGDDQLLKFNSDGEFVMQIGRANRSRGNTDTENVNRAADVDVGARAQKFTRTGLAPAGPM